MGNNFIEIEKNIVYLLLLRSKKSNQFNEMKKCSISRAKKIYLFLNDKKMEEDIFKIFTKNRMIVE